MESKQKKRVVQADACYIEPVFPDPDSCSQVLTFFFLRDDDASPSVASPALTNPSLAAALMSANRLGPSLTPPYHLDTTTTTFHRSMTCNSFSNRAPAAVSPSSSQSCTATAALAFSRTRHAVMLCVAWRTRLSVVTRCVIKDCAWDGDETRATRAINVDFAWTMGSETAHGGGKESL